MYSLLLIGSILSASDFNIAFSGTNGKVDGFSLSIGEYYQIPQREIIILERHLPREEVGLVYYLSRHSHRDASYITKLRMRGVSWWDITLHLGLDPRRLYLIDMPTRYASPKGYGHSNHYRLNDREIIDVVNVRFLSDYHRIPYREVNERRHGGERFEHIDRHYREQRHGNYGNKHETREDRRNLKEERRDHH